MEWRRRAGGDRPAAVVMAINGRPFRLEGETEGRGNGGAEEVEGWRHRFTSGKEARRPEGEPGGGSFGRPVVAAWHCRRRKKAPGGPSGPKWPGCSWAGAGERERKKDRAGKGFRAES